MAQRVMLAAFDGRDAVVTVSDCVVMVSSLLLCIGLHERSRYLQIVIEARNVFACNESSSAALAWNLLLTSSPCHNRNAHERSCRSSMSRLRPPPDASAGRSW